MTNGTSPRTELLHNIDPLSGNGPFGSASLRIGDFKLISGSPGKDGHFVPPGCPPTVCVPPVMPSASSNCSADSNQTQVRKHTFFAPFCCKKDLFPRQARDKHTTGTRS